MPSTIVRCIYVPIKMYGNMKYIYIYKYVTTIYVYVQNQHCRSLETWLVGNLYNLQRKKRNMRLIRKALEVVELMMTRQEDGGVLRFQRLVKGGEWPWSEYFPLKRSGKRNKTLSIQVCPKKGSTLHSYSKDGIGTLNPLLGRDLDP